MGKKDKAIKATTETPEEETKALPPVSTETKEVKNDTVKADPAPKEALKEKESKPELTAFQLKERKKRTIFVGNVPVNSSAKSLQKLFRECGKIEKIWFRSVCVAEDSKQP